MILELFYILFKTNADEVKKGTEQVAASTKELTVDLKTLTDTGDQVGKNFMKIGHALTDMIAGIFSVHTIVGALRDTFANTSSLDLSSRMLGTDVGDLEAWGRALEKTGGDVNTFKSSIKSLAGVLNTNYGDAVRVLPILAAKFKELTPYFAMQFGHTLGIDDSLILLLRESGDNLTNLINKQKELSGLTEKDTKAAQDFGDAWVDVSHEVNSAVTEFETTVFPVLTAGLKAAAGMIQFFRDHVWLAKLALVAITAVLLRFGFYMAAIPGIIAIAVLTFAEFKKVFDWVGGTANKTMDYFIKKWEALAEAIKTVRDFLIGLKDAFKLSSPEHFDSINAERSRHESPFKHSLFKSLQIGQDALGLASVTPLNSQTAGGSVSSSSSRKSVNVTMGDVNVHTQATSSDQIASDVSKNLMKQISEAVNNYDDGILA